MQWVVGTQGGAVLKRHHFLTMFMSGVAKNAQRTSPLRVVTIKLLSDVQHGAPVVQPLPVQTGPRVGTVLTTGEVPETQQGGEEDPRCRHVGGGEWTACEVPSGRCRLLSELTYRWWAITVEPRTERGYSCSGRPPPVADTRLHSKHRPQQLS